MTQPTHGLDPNALEAALREYDLAVEWHSYHMHDVNREADQHAAAAKLANVVRKHLAALSQNPGTSNTSGEAEPVAWRFKADAYVYYDDAYVYCATEEMALLRCPKNSKVEPLYAALEPRASDRERTIEECARVGNAALTTILAQLPKHINLSNEALSAVTAIRKLSEVSHEH